MMNFVITFTPAKTGWYVRLKYVALLAVMVVSPLVLSSASMAADGVDHDAVQTRFESSNYLKGVEAYRAGEYRQAFDAWSLGAYEEDAESQYNLGVLYLEGRGVERNAEQARSWFLRAAQKNHPEAQYNLGHMSLSGMAVEKDMDAALEWWRRSAEGGYAQAQFNYGRALYLGIRGEPDMVAGLVLIRRAATNGDARAQQFLDENKAEVAAVDDRPPVLDSVSPLAISGADPTDNTVSTEKRHTDDRVISQIKETTLAETETPVSRRAPQVIALEPLASPEVSDQSSGNQPVVRLLEEELPLVVALPPALPEMEENSAPVAEARPTVVTQARGRESASDTVVLAPDIGRQEVPAPPALNIVRDEAPVLHDYFLRTVDEDVPLYAGIDSSTAIDTLSGKTLLRVRTIEGDKLLVDALNRSEVWVLAMGTEIVDGLAFSRGKLVPMFNQPGGRQIGMLPQHQSMLLLERRKGWQKLSLVRRLNGWIDARSLAYSGETAPQLKARWEASLKGLALSKQRQN